MTDLAIDYSGGIQAPNPTVAGLPVFAAYDGTNLAYQRSAQPHARDVNGADTGTTDVFDVVPVVLRFDTPDVTPVVLGQIIPLPNNTALKLQVEYHVRNGADAFAIRWYTLNYRNVDGAITLIGTATNEQTPIDALGGIGGLTFTPATSRLTISATGTAAQLFWLVTIKVVSQLKLNR